MLLGYARFRAVALRGWMGIQFNPALRVPGRKVGGQQTNEEKHTYDVQFWRGEPSVNGSSYCLNVMFKAALLLLYCSMEEGQNGQDCASTSFDTPYPRLAVSGVGFTLPGAG